LKQDDARAALRLGILCQRLGHPHEAFSLCEKAHKLGNVDAAFELAMLHMELGDMGRAMELIKEARAQGHAKANKLLASDRLDVSFRLDWLERIQGDTKREESREELPAAKRQKSVKSCRTDTDDFELCALDDPFSSRQECICLREAQAPHLPQFST